MISRLYSAKPHPFFRHSRELQARGHKRMSGENKTKQSQKQLKRTTERCPSSSRFRVFGKWEGNTQAKVQARSLLKTKMRRLKIFSEVMNHLEAGCGVSRGPPMTFPQVVTPECFNRGSTVLTTTLSHVEWVGGPVRNSPGFPLKSMRE